MGFTTSFAMAMHNGHIHRVYFVTYLATQTASLQPHGTSPSVHLMNKLCDASEGGVRIARGYTETDVVSECTTLATTTQAGGLLGSCRANVSPEHWNRIH